MSILSSVTVAKAKEVLLALNGAIEGFHHGHPDFRVNNKIFATLWPGENRSVLMLGPEMSESLAASHGEGFRVVGGGKCLNIQLDSIDESEFQALAETAWSRFSGG